MWILLSKPFFSSPSISLGSFQVNRKFLFKFPRESTKEGNVNFLGKCTRERGRLRGSQHYIANPYGYLFAQKSLLLLALLRCKVCSQLHFMAVEVVTTYVHIGLVALGSSSQNYKG